MIVSLIDLLKPLKSAKIELCSQNVPTLHLVLPTKMQLTKLYESSPQDDVIIKKIKESILRSLNTHFTITQFHETATLLMPAVKSLKNLLTIDKIKELHQFIINLMEGIDVEENATQVNIELNSNLSSCLAMFADKSPNIQTIGSPEIELNKYLISEKFHSNPIYFWNKNKNNFRRLAIIAKKLFSIPATNLSSERNFNYAGLTLTDRRSSLNPDNVDKFYSIKKTNN